ncbi:MAG: hypothetical protein LBP58_03460 [Azoarcus sp.]|nr:hypothetical protein [Azoarcus sp.]
MQSVGQSGALYLGCQRAVFRRESDVAYQLPQCLARDGHVLDAIEACDQIAIDFAGTGEHLRGFKPRDRAQLIVRFLDAILRRLQFGFHRRRDDSCLDRRDDVVALPACLLAPPLDLRRIGPHGFYDLPALTLEAAETILIQKRLFHSGQQHVFDRRSPDFQRIRACACPAVLVRCAPVIIAIDNYKRPATHPVAQQTAEKIFFSATAGRAPLPALLGRL